MAVPIGYEDLAVLEETLEILSESIALVERRLETAVC